MTDESPIIDEVRKRADEISRRYEHDLRSYAQHLQQLQAKLPRPVVDQPTVTTSPQTKSGSKPAA